MIGLNIFLNNGLELKLYATYLQPSKIISTREVNTILANETYPAMIVGDLNSKHPAWFSRTTNPNGLKLFSEMQKSDWIVNAPDSPTRFPTQANRNPDVLDILVCKNITCTLNQTPITALNSDHIPVLVELDAHILDCPSQMKLIKDLSIGNLFKKISPTN